MTNQKSLKKSNTTNMDQPQFVEDENPATLAREATLRAKTEHAISDTQIVNGFVQSDPDELSQLTAKMQHFYSEYCKDKNKKKFDEQR